jgi:hypothetical protein
MVGSGVPGFWLRSEGEGVVEAAARPSVLSATPVDEKQDMPGLPARRTVMSPRLCCMFATAAACTVVAVAAVPAGDHDGHGPDWVRPEFYVTEESSADGGMHAWVHEAAPPAWRRQGGSAPVSELTRQEGVSVTEVGARGGGTRTPEHLIDDNDETDFRFEWGNGGAWVVIDLGRPCVLEGLAVTNAAQAHRVVWLTRCAVAPDTQHFRDITHARINLAMKGEAPIQRIPLPPSVGRFVRLEFAGGPGGACGIAEVRLFGRMNRPERHLMCWWGDLERDLMAKLDYFENDLAATDLWLDYVQTAFPQSSHNSGWAVVENSGLLPALQDRGIRYWLAEHEAFTLMVNCPADLRDDAKWFTLIRQARVVYERARNLGFRGLVLDAEDYDGVTDEAKDAYKDVADHVTAFSFADEFGYSGHYYRRGLEYGRTLKAVWDAPLIQVYESRMYAGTPGCRDGNYWWLKGIHDAGIEIWIATERTYGAGKSELKHDSAPHLFHWFVRPEEYIPKVHRAYPFATRVLPGFHPWNCRTKRANYLPKYLDEQLRLATSTALGCWIYTEGLPHGGDPRETLDSSILESQGLQPEQFLDVLRRSPVWTPVGRPPYRDDNQADHPEKRQERP